jgi:hypothetical protein
VDSRAVIVNFDGTKEGLTSVLVVLEMLFAEEFVFQSAPEGFHGGIIVAITLAAHARLDAGLAELRAVFAAGVLHASIGMKEEFARGLAMLDGHAQGGQDQGALKIILHGPADDPAAVEIHDCGQVEPAFASRDVGDIADPDLVDASGGRPLGQVIGRDGMIMVAVGGADAKRAPASSHQAPFSHEPFDALMVAVLATGLELVSQARAAVVLFGLQKEAFNEKKELLIVLLARAGLAFAPRVVRAAGQPQSAAEIGDRIEWLELFHSLAALGGVERMARVFFRISH